MAPYKPAKDCKYAKTDWKQLNQLIEDSRPITEEEYALYRRRMEWVEWLQGCPCFYNLYRVSSFFDNSVPYGWWNGMIQRFSPTHFRFKLFIKNTMVYIHIF